MRQRQIRMLRVQQGEAFPYNKFAHDALRYTRTRVRRVPPNFKLKFYTRKNTAKETFRARTSASGDPGAGCTPRSRETRQELQLGAGTEGRGDRDARSLPWKFIIDFHERRGRALSTRVRGLVARSREARMERGGGEGRGQGPEGPGEKKIESRRVPAWPRRVLARPAAD